ncbi:MAG: hypothetical protein HY047_08350 [Acidobacteria bacterium]|nr:hypothetical protein [Acidobacteriota bacterium]
MELLLGSHVREHGSRVGRLAGFELEPANRSVRRIIFSPDGDLGPQAATRPLVAVSLVHDNGEIELRPNVEVAPLPAVPDVVLLSRATRVRRDGRQVGRLTGIEVDVADRALVSVHARAHRWSRRSTLAAADLDCSTPGEVRARDAGGTRAA